MAAVLKTVSPFAKRAAGGAVATRIAVASIRDLSGIAIGLTCLARPRCQCLWSPV